MSSVHVVKPICFAPCLASSQWQSPRHAPRIIIAAHCVSTELCLYPLPQDDKSNVVSAQRMTLVQPVVVHGASANDTTVFQLAFPVIIAPPAGSSLPCPLNHCLAGMLPIC